MEPVHMIDADSNFCKANADSIINRSAELSAPDAPYAVVSIVGAQSSGKSYLMNRLFGTKFPVMNAQLGRSQTSRGIMMSSCSQPSLVLLDVEGFDGIENGEDTLFEKRAALFALVVSDLMMINMSIRDIGRQQGSATPLFRTIFKERTKITSGITNLLVVLRFYDGETPLEVLRRDVLKNLEKMWESVNTESAKFKEYIEVNIVALRDKDSPEFSEEVAALKNLISNSRSAKVPASGFSLSSSMYWDTIKGNKDLDIPSHQVAVATIYCRQLVEDTIISLNSQDEYKLLKAEKSPGCFNKISHELLEKIKAEYDEKAKWYDPDVRDKERQNLVDRLTKDFDILAQVRKEYNNNRILGYAKLGISAANVCVSAVGLGIGVVRSSIVAGDYVVPVFSAVRHLVSAAHDHLSGVPSNDTPMPPTGLLPPLPELLPPLPPAAPNASGTPSPATPLTAAPQTDGASTSDPPIPDEPTPRG